jgi:hypothetical protein
MHDGDTREPIHLALARTRAQLLSLERSDLRRARRLTLDFLDARTDFERSRLDETALRAELERIAEEASAPAA